MGTAKVDHTRAIYNQSGNPRKDRDKVMLAIVDSRSRYSSAALTDYRPRGHDVIRIANAQLYSRKYSDTNKVSCTA